MKIWKFAFALAFLLFWPINFSRFFKRKAIIFVLFWLPYFWGNVNSQCTNDTCGGATSISLGIPVSGSTLSPCTSDNAPSCPFAMDASNGGVWYKITCIGDSGYIASLCSPATNFNTQLRVFSGTCGSLNCVAGNNDQCDTLSKASWCTTPGSTYYILVYGSGVVSGGNFTLLVTSQAPPMVNLGADFTTCMGTALLDAGNPGATYAWSNAAITQTTTVSTTGTYSVTVTDVNTCQNNDAVVVTFNTAPVVNLGPDTTHCSPGTILLDAANAGATYAWSTGATSQTISVSTSNTYAVTVTQPGIGCTGNDAIVVNFVAQPTVNLGADYTSCIASELLDAGNPGATYAWSNAATTQTTTVTTTGTYSVTITDANGCDANDDVTVTFNIAPVVNLGPDTTHCGPGTILLDAGNAGATYAWSTGATSQTISVSTSNTYAVTVTQPGVGCTGNDAIVVTFVAQPTVNLAADYTSCMANEVLDAGNPGATYLWSNADMTQTTTVTTTGTYSVTITDANGCDANDDVTVTFNTAPVVNLGPDSIHCGPGTIVLDAGHPGATYAWSTFAVTQTISVSMDGTYSVTVTEVGVGCTGTDAIDISFVTAPTVNLGPDSAICSGTIVLDAGNPGATYAWSDASTSQTISVSTPENYAVTVTDPSGCTAMDDVNVNGGTLPVINLGNDTSLCAFSLMLDAGNPGASYLWSNTDVTQTTTVSTSGTYSVTVTNPGLNCTATDAIDVTFSTPPIVDIGPDSTLCSGTITLDAGNPGMTYAWSNTDVTQTTNVATPGTYTVTVTGLPGCSASDAIVINAGTIPTVDLGGDTSLCGGSLMLDAGNAGADYSWSTAATTQTITVSTSATYSVTVTNPGLGCDANDAIVVTINALPIVNLGPDSTLCAGTITLDAANPGMTYVWSPTAVTQTINVTSPGNYSVTVTNLVGCSSSDAVVIIPGTLPTDSLGADLSSCVGGTVILNAGNTGAISYLWNTVETTQAISITTTGIYSVTIVNLGLGCQASFSISINLIDNPDPQIVGEFQPCLNEYWVKYQVLPSLNHIHWTVDPAKGIIQSGQDTNTVFVHWYNNPSLTSIFVWEQMWMPPHCIGSDLENIVFTNDTAPEPALIDTLEVNSPYHTLICVGPCNYSIYKWGWEPVGVYPPAESLEHCGPQSAWSYAEPIDTIDKYYWVYVGNGTDCDNCLTKSYLIEPPPEIGIDAPSSSTSEISLYPNPTSESFNLKSENEIIEEVQIVDLWGRLLYSLKCNLTEVNVTAESISEGIYFVRVKMRDGWVMKKLQVQR